MCLKSKCQKIIITLDISYCYSITILRSARWPNDWAEAHWLLNYNSGFIKRGLIGHLLKPIIFINGPLNAEINIKLLSLISFFIFSVSIIFIVANVLRNNNYTISSVLLSISFLTSPYIVMSAHLNGYFDNIIISLSILACYFIKQNKVWYATIIISVGILIHEAIIIIGLPPILITAYCKFHSSIKSFSLLDSINGFIRYYRSLIMLPLAVFIYLLVQQHFIADEITARILSNSISKLKFIENNRHTVPFALNKTIFTYFSDQHQYFLQRLFSFTCIAQIIPALSLFMFYIWYKIKNQKYSKLVLFNILLISTLPLFLHLVAWDTNRIWSFTLISAMICIWGISEAIENKPKPTESLLFIVCAGMIAMYNILISNQLMDKQLERFSDEYRILFYLPVIIVTLLTSLNRYKFNH